MKHRGGGPGQRVFLSNGMLVVLYDDGLTKIAGCDRTVVVTEAQSRTGSGHVIIK